MASVAETKMSLNPYMNNSMMYLNNEFIEAASDVYIDSVKSDLSDFVSEEIEVNCDTEVVHRVVESVEVLPSSSYSRMTAKDQNEKFPLNEYGKCLSQTDSIQTPTNTSTNRVATVLKKILFLRPNEDPELAKAKALKDLMASVEVKTALQVKNGIAIPPETIVEIVSIKAPTKQKPRIPSANSLMTSKATVLREKSCQELDSPSFSQLRSQCRTPSPARRESSARSEVQDLDHQNCYFDSQSLSLRLTSLDRVGVKSRENFEVSKKDGLNDAGSKYTVHRMRKSFEGDRGIAVRSKSCSEEILAADLELSEDPNCTGCTDDVTKGKIYPVQSVKEQFYNSLNEKVKDYQRKDRDERPPFSYAQLIQMALSTKVDKKMALREIYQWIENNFAYYRYLKNPGWKNSIRHSLSLSDAFVRKKINHSGRSATSYWTLETDKLPGKNIAADMARRNFSEINGPCKSRETALLPSSARPVIGKRRLSAENKQLTKQSKLCKRSNTVLTSAENGPTVGYDLIVDSSLADDLLGVGSLNCCSQAADELTTRPDTPGVPADSTTEEDFTTACANELLRQFDKGAFVADQPDILKMKVCRPHRRKQDLKVLCRPLEVDNDDLPRFAKDVAASSCSFDDVENNEVLVGEEVFWMKMLECDEMVQSLKDGDEFDSVLFQNLFWTSPVQDLAPVPSNACLSIAPLGLESELTVADLDNTHNGRMPLQTAADGAFCSVQNIPRWISDCYGSCLPTADGKLDSHIFGNLLSEEGNCLDAVPDPDFIENLFSF